MVHVSENGYVRQLILKAFRQRDVNYICEKNEKLLYERYLEITFCKYFYMYDVIKY